MASTCTFCAPHSAVVGGPEVQVQIEMATELEARIEARKLLPATAAAHVVGLLACTLGLLSMPGCGTMRKM